MRPARWLKLCSFWLRWLWHPREIDQELDDEIAYHLEATTEENLAKGMSPEEARRAARLELGGVEQVKEKMRSVRAGAWLETLLQDIRFGVRMLRKNPGFTAVAVLTLALGIGANTAIFSLIDRVLLRSLPVARPSQLVLLKWSARRAPKVNGYDAYGDCVDNLRPGAKNPSGCSFSEPVFRKIEQAGIFSGTAAFAGAGQIDLAGHGRPRVIYGQFVSGNFFHTLGLQAAVGRLIDSRDDQPSSAAVVVLNYGLWQSAFGASPDVVGHTIRLDNAPFIVIGVAKRRFTGLTPGSDFAVWIPLADAHLMNRRHPWNNRQADVTVWWLTIVGRLKPSEPLLPAQAAVSNLFRNEMLYGAAPFFNGAADSAASRGGPAGHPKPPSSSSPRLVGSTSARKIPSSTRSSAPAVASIPPSGSHALRKPTFVGEPITKPLSTANDHPVVSLIPAQTGLSGYRAVYANPLYLLMVAVGIILLIACANLAGLMLARSAARRKELTVRLVLGATRRRIIHQVLTESLLLSAIGAAIGILFAMWGARVFASFTDSIHRGALAYAPSLDLRVFLFTLCVSFFAGVLFGLAPAFGSSRLDLAPGLKEGEGGSAALARSLGGWLTAGDGLVVSQVALAVVVLVGAGLVVRTLDNLRRLGPGFNPQNVVIFRIDPSLLGYQPAQIDSLYRDLQGRLAETPGVRAVSYSATTLLSNGFWVMGIHLPGTPQDRIPYVNELAVGQNFFSTMQIPLLLGRSFHPSDFPRAASHASPTPNAAPKPAIVNQAFVAQYLGKVSPIGKEFAEAVANPYRQDHPGYQIVGVVRNSEYRNLRGGFHPIIYIPQSGSGATFEVRTLASPQAILPSIRKTVAEINSALPLYGVESQSQQIDRLLSRDRLLAWLCGFFAILALSLACIGLYGLLAYETTRRTREIGIRMALGARPVEILRRVIGRGMALAVAGSAVGLVVALTVMRYISTFLYGLKPTDPLTLAEVVVVLMVVALCASWVPARRAMNIDPMVALRYE